MELKLYNFAFFRFDFDDVLILKPKIDWFSFVFKTSLNKRKIEENRGKIIR